MKGLLGKIARAIGFGKKPSTPLTAKGEFDIQAPAPILWRAPRGLVWDSRNGPVTHPLVNGRPDKTKWVKFVRPKWVRA